MTTDPTQILRQRNAEVAQIRGFVDLTEEAKERRIDEVSERAWVELWDVLPYLRAAQDTGEVIYCEEGGRRLTLGRGRPKLWAVVLTLPRRESGVRRKLCRMLSGALTTPTTSRRAGVGRRRAASAAAGVARNARLKPLKRSSGTLPSGSSRAGSRRGGRRWSTSSPIPGFGPSSRSGGIRKPKSLRTG
jgi:hypothetical protein